MLCCAVYCWRPSSACPCVLCRVFCWVGSGVSALCISLTLFVSLRASLSCRGYALCCCCSQCCCCCPRCCCDVPPPHCCCAVLCCFYYITSGLRSGCAKASWASWRGWCSTGQMMWSSTGEKEGGGVVCVAVVCVCAVCVCEGGVYVHAFV